MEIVLLKRPVWGPWRISDYGAKRDVHKLLQNYARRNEIDVSPGIRRAP